jgi:hypothetical protein
MQWSDKAEENQLSKETTFSGNFSQNMVDAPARSRPCDDRSGVVTTGGTGKNEIDKIKIERHQGQQIKKSLHFIKIKPIGVINRAN